MTHDEYIEITGGIGEAGFVALVERLSARDASPEEWAEVRKIGDAIIARRKTLADMVLNGVVS